MASRTEWIHAVLVLTLWVSFARQLLLVDGHPRTVEQRSTCAAIGLFALAMTLLMPPVYLLVDRLTAVPNSSRLLANGLGMCSGWAISPVRVRALRRQGRPGLLGSGWLLLATLAVETILFVVAHTDESVPGNFAERYATVDAVLAYRVVLMAYVGAVMGQLFWAGWGHRASTRAIQARYRRIQSQMQTMGWGCGTAYALHEAIYPLLVRFKLALPINIHTLIQYTMLGGFVLLLLGSGVVSVGHWLVRYSEHRRLYPLWRDLRQLVPSIVNNSSFAPPGTALQDMAITTELDQRTHDRVTEMQDGLLALRQYAASPVVMYAHRLCQDVGMGADEAEAIGDAAIVAAAIHCPGNTQASDVDTTYAARGSGDPEHELRHFLRVAWAYRRSSIVRRSLRQIAGTSGPMPPSSPRQQGV